MIAILIPLKTISTANARLNRFKLAAMTKAQRSTTRNALMSAAPMPPAPPITVVITRIGPKKMDSDNLAISQKGVRDGVADWLGVDDGDQGIQWVYEQRAGGPKVYAIEVEVIK